MTTEMILARLKRAGTAQNRKVYARHGVTGDQFGVSYAELRKLVREIKVDSDLAKELWDSGHHEARLVATMIIDPADITAPLLEDWVKTLDNYPITDAFSKMVSQTRFAIRKAEKWADSKSDFVGQAGWNLIGALAMDERCSDDWLRPRLAEIRDTITERDNRTRHAMNGALICIGISRGNLRKEAYEIADQVSPVEVDHGDTDCKTPHAKQYIHNALAHRAARMGLLPEQQQQQQDEASEQPAKPAAKKKTPRKRTRR